MISNCVVALFTRAWIEICENCNGRTDKRVALFTRAWIEILLLLSKSR